MLSPARGGGQECRQGEWTIGCKLKLPLWGTENNRAKLKAGEPQRGVQLPQSPFLTESWILLEGDENQAVLLSSGPQRAPGLTPTGLALPVTVQEQPASRGLRARAPRPPSCANITFSVTSGFPVFSHLHNEIVSSLPTS